MVSVMGLERVADDGFTSTSKRWLSKGRVVSPAFYSAAAVSARTRASFFCSRDFFVMVSSQTGPRVNR